MNKLRSFLSKKVTLAVCMLGFSASLPAIFAQEETPTQQSVPADFDALISGLDSEEFSTRQEATQKLAEQGTLALPALEKAMQGESREASSRALDLIKKLFESKDSATKQQAEAALKRLAESDKPAVANRAQNILAPPQELPRPVPGAQPQIAPIRIRFQAANGDRKVSIRDQNGVRDIEAVDKGRKVKIHDDPNNGIQVEITETKDGKEETKKYEAKNAEELKKNHPDAHQAYEEFGKRNGGQIKIFGGNGQAVPLPGLPGPGIPAGVPGADPETIRQRRIEGLERALEGVQRAMDELERQKLRILEQKAQLEREVPAPAPAAKPAEVPAEKPAEVPNLAPPLR